MESVTEAISYNKRSTLSSFYFQNKDIDLITHEPHCHHLCYKSFAHSYSCSFPKASRMINFEIAFSYTVVSVVLLSYAYGSVCKTNKSKLAHMLISKLNEENTDESKESTVHVVDLLTLIWVSETFEDLSLKLISILLKLYLRIDLVAAYYFENFIKTADSEKRVSSIKIIIKSSKSEVPRWLSNFLLNKKNKTCMIELLFESRKDCTALVLWEHRRWSSYHHCKG